MIKNSIDKERYDFLLFGGTFNPIHNGHIDTARYVAEKLKVRKIILIPSANPPFKSNVLDFSHRVKMVALATDNDDIFRIYCCEGDREGPSYTIDTVRYLKNKLGKNVGKFYLLIGSDIINQIEKWNKIEELSNEVTIVTACRPGYDYNNILEKWKSDKTCGKDFNKKSIIDNFIITPEIDISSTIIRDRIKNGLSISDMVSLEVENYINKHNLYKGKK